MAEEKDYFDDLLKELDDPSTELSEEEQRRKNKDAEEARKRREAEAKAKKEAEQESANSEAAEQEAEAETEEEPKAEEPAKEETPTTKVEEEPKADTDVNAQAQRTNKLGEQLVQFKNRYPNVDLATLDKDTNFKRFIEGKILGKKDFTALYEDYIDFTSSVSGRSQQELRTNYERKAQASSGSSKPKGPAKPKEEVFSQEELNKLAARLPLMSDREAKRIMEKFERSVEYYKNN